MPKAYELSKQSVNGYSDDLTYDKNYIFVNKWILLGCVLVACLAIVGVGLGVYYGTRDQSQHDYSAAVTSAARTLSKRTSLSTTPSPDYRLPKNLYPTDYYLSVRVNIPSPSGLIRYASDREFTFEGNLTIAFNVSYATQTITMQMHEIKIWNACLVDSNGTDIELITDPLFEFDNITQKLVFTLASGTLEAGQLYNLSIEYTGFINDDLVGLYRNKYVESGQERWLAVTSFEPTDARRALPCFDEPEYKAVFHVTIIHPADMVALSNAMELPTVSLGNGWASTSFEPTFKMSTYLFAMLVADYKMNSHKAPDGKLFRVWARPSLINDSEWALYAGPKALAFYTEYFNLSLPLKKIDTIALPDFVGDGMENWGMITFTESDILFNNATYSGNNLEYMTSMIAHELAHQWFGDLVTMAWWDDLWLNEGFAEFMQYKGTDSISNGDFKMDWKFVPMEIEVSMYLDQVASSQPIYDQTLQTPDEINGAFGPIAYNKGASVIRQLEFVVGEDVFKDGLNTYLTRFSFGNADHDDFWSCIQSAVNSSHSPLGWDGELLSVVDFMNPWLLQQGFPLVTVTRSDDLRSAAMQQSRFILPGNFTINPKYNYSPYNFTWYIPIRYNTESTGVSDMLWIKPNATTSIENLKPSEWLLVNTDVYGLYRVNYDTANWQLLNEQLLSNYSAIDPRNRAQLLSDALSLARSGHLPYNISLNLTKYLVKEVNYVPWLAVSGSFQYYQNMFALSSSSDEIYGKYIRTLVSPMYNKIGWNDTDSREDVTMQELHQYLVTTMCEVESSDCLARAKSMYDFMLFQPCNSSINGTSSCSSVDPNFRKPVYCAGVSQGGADDFEFLYAKYAQEPISVERDNIMYGMCCSKYPWALSKLLNAVIDPRSSLIRQQDSPSVFKYIASNDVGREILWPFFVTNFDKLSDLFSSGVFSFSDIIAAVTESFNTQNDVEQMQQFLVENQEGLGSGLNTFILQLQNAQANVIWMDTYADQVLQWFADNSN